MGKIQVGDCVLGPPAALPLIKYTSCREDERLPTEGKIFSKYDKTDQNSRERFHQTLPCTTVRV